MLAPNLHLEQAEGLRASLAIRNSSMVTRMPHAPETPETTAESAHRRPEWGKFGGMVELADDFNASMPEIERPFYGEPESPTLNALRRASGP
jgi:hypothetical protein